MNCRQISFAGLNDFLNGNCPVPKSRLSRLSKDQEINQDDFSLLLPNVEKDLYEDRSIRRKVKQYVQQSLKDLKRKINPTMDGLVEIDGLWQCKLVTLYFIISLTPIFKILIIYKNR